MPTAGRIDMQFRPGEVNIICRDVAVSLAFYRDVLGFTVVEVEDGAVRLAAGDRHFLLLPFATAERPKWDYVSTPDFSFDLMVDNLAAAFTYLQEKGVTMAQPWKSGEPSFIIQDPDGLFIEIIGE